MLGFTADFSVLDFPSQPPQKLGGEGENLLEAILSFLPTSHHKAKGTLFLLAAVTPPNPPLHLHPPLQQWGTGTPFLPC